MSRCGSWKRSSPAFPRRALDVVRALAIGLYATFLGLAFAVDRRGGRARMAVIVVSILFFLLVGDAGPADQAEWVAGLALSAVGAMVMTARLRSYPGLVHS